VAFVGFLTLLATPGTRAGATPPLNAYGQLPSLDHAAVSPDGAHIALLGGTAEARSIAVVTSDGKKVVIALPVGDAKVRDVAWGDASHLIITTSTTAKINGLTGPQREWYIAIVFDIVTGKHSRLLEGAENAIDSIFNTPTILKIGGRATAFVEGESFPGTQGVFTLYRQDLASGIPTVIAVGNENTQDFLVDDTGHIAARVDCSEATGRWALWSGKDDHLSRSVEITAPLDSPDLIGFSGNQDTLLVGLPDGDHRVYRELVRGSTTLSPPLHGLEDSGIIQDSATRTVIGSVNSTLASVDYTFLAPADQQSWAAIKRAFPHDIVRFESWSADRRMIVLKVEGQSGAAFFKLDMSTRHADWLGDEYTDIGADDIGPVKAFHYDAADGTTIPAYLTLPTDRGTSRLPLVVLVHGGPAARDDPGFDWWAQGLASLGYAVFQPQYRGSDGFGDAFMTSGYGQWGRKMQTDVSDGVKYLADAGTIDPARVCIVGGSYGGYAALAGVTLQSGIYRCAVSLAGPSDLRRFLASEATKNDGSGNSTLRYWRRFMGAQSSSDPTLDAISPARLADRVKVPVLLIHGLDDTVVPFEQSKIMADALNRAGNPTQLVTMKSEDHWLSRSATRMAMLHATADFLAKHNPVEAQPPAK
jgi:cephalosporin-C deacetylase-like acetyl esterase